MNALLLPYPIPYFPLEGRAYLLSFYYHFSLSNQITVFIKHPVKINSIRLVAYIDVIVTLSEAKGLG